MEFNIQTSHSASDYYRNGMTFKDAAWRCFGTVEDGSYKIIDNGKLCQLTAPAVVNAAFACELFFKALLLHYGIADIHGHNLLELFQELPIAAQNTISSFCSKPNNIAEFEHTLEQHSRDFVDIRYYVENNGWTGMSPTYMISLCHNLGEITKYLLFQSNKSSD